MNEYFLERVTSLTEAATAAANASTQAVSSMSTRESAGLESATRIRFSKHEMCLQEKTQWCFRHGSSNSRHGYLLVTQRFQEVLEKVEDYEMIHLIRRLFTTEEKELSAKL